MKLLEMAKAVADESTSPIPDTFNTNNLPPESRTLLRSLNKAGAFLIRASDWNIMLREATVTPSATTPAIPRANLPQPFLRFKKNSFRDKAGQFYTGPVDYSDYVRQIANTNHNIFTINSAGVHIHPSTKSPVTFGYYHKEWAQGNRRIDGESQLVFLTKMGQDEDTSFIDDEILIATAKFFALEAMGVNGASAQQEVKFLRKALDRTEESESIPYYKYPTSGQRYVYGL